MGELFKWLEVRAGEDEYNVNIVCCTVVGVSDD